MKYVYVNEAFARMHNRKAEDVIGSYESSMLEVKLAKANKVHSKLIRLTGISGKPRDNVKWKLEDGSNLGRHRIQEFQVFTYGFDDTAEEGTTGTVTYLTPAGSSQDASAPRGKSRAKRYAKATGNAFSRAA